MIGRTLAHYRITAAIGAGGMGQVYRATDTRLGRDVALKILPAEMAASAEMTERFRREARAVAALNHPNIVTIHSVEEADGLHFLTMELVQGQSLDRLIPAGGLEIQRILDIATALSAALAAAHDKGIVHRDLKPANVMVADDGGVKVLDFGLAKLTGSEAIGHDSELSTAMQTDAGVIMGTRPYMSPEQVQGRPLDHRTDIFSLGVVLYEMTTGRRPFHGQSNADLFASILRDPAPPVTEARAELPADLSRVIKRCLEKDPRRRMQTARDIGNELRETGRPLSHSASIEPARAASGEGSGGALVDEGFRVAVLPFKYSGANPDLKALAEGMSEEMVTGLSRFSYLRVIASGQTVRYANEAKEGRAAGKEIGARYVMEGSLRQAGPVLRIAVQLVDANSGAHLWAETYNRPFAPEEIFALQDELVPRIVSTVADLHGVLPRSMTEAARSRPPDQLSPYEAVLRSFGYFERVTAEDLAASRSGLELAVRKAPAYADAWAMLALLCVQDHAQGFGLDADSLASGLTAARRAVEVGPSSHLAHFSLAQALFFAKDLPSFKNAAERAAALNPMDGNSIAFLGELLTYAGDSERGLALAERAKQLNPHHPGWYWYANFYDAYRRGDDRGALGFALKVNMPGHWGMQFMKAAACGQLGERDAAGRALQDLLKLRPECTATFRSDVDKWWDSEYSERLIDGLRKAGLAIPEAPGQGPRADGSAADPGTSSVAGHVSPSPRSGESRADEGFWVAVLPFKYAGSDADVKALAEGLSEEIVTGLSRFSYLRVIARSSTSRFASGATDLRAIGSEIGASYVMEGSLRQAGAALRVSVQLLDTSTGAHLWAETYDRPFRAEDVFALQDDLVPRIVSTCADHFGVLARAISEAVRGKPLAEMTPYDALMRGFGYHFRLSPIEHAEARDALERAVERAPNNADCWAMLSWVYSHEHAHSFNPRPGALDRALDAARRAVDLAPSNHLAQQTLAVVLFFRKETAACRSACERALALNPLDGSNEAMFLLTFSGDWERGCALVRQAMDRNPHHPLWYRVVLALNAYRTGNYRLAVDEVVKANAPEIFWTNFLLAAAHAQLGDAEAARQAVSDLLTQKDDFAQSGEGLLRKWFEPQLVADLMVGLRKAGLSIPSGPGVPATPNAAGPGPLSSSGPSRADEGFWVAVLPFKYSGSDADIASLADGLSEEIITGLSRFSYLRVIARGSTSRIASGATDLRAIGKEIGARYVMDGSLRQAGARLRVAAQLTDATTGAHLWAETYDRAFSAEDVFALQDELVARIVSTVADQHGVLPHSMSGLIRNKSNEMLTPLEAVLRVFSFHERMSPEEHRNVRALLERVVREHPDEGDCWAMLATLYADEFMFGFEGEPDPLSRAQAAAQRAVEIAPTSWLAAQALAQSLFFRRELQAFRPVAERTIALNPMDSAALAFISILLALSGAWERGLEVSNAARKLNPHFPGWYWLTPIFHAYHQRDYRGAIDAASRINMPGYFWRPATQAAAFGQLGESGPARKAVNELLEIRPDFAASARDEFERWFDPEFLEHFIEGLRKAGLTVPSSIPPGEGVPATPNPAEPGSRSSSGVSRADEGFRVAVLPFKYGGSDADLKALAEGLSDEIVTGLSRFSYLRVVSRTATNGAGSADQPLGPRYVMEGSLRQAGTRLRLAVQLVDALSGAHLWAENYERTFSPEAVFELQDDLVPRIVSTVADQNGILTRRMSETLRSKSEDLLTPHEAVLRAFSYFQRVTPEEHAVVRRTLERATREAPDDADGWAMLSLMYAVEFADDFNPGPHPLDRALAAAQRAVHLAATHALGHYALAFVYFLRKEIPSFRAAAEKALALNPMDGSVMGILGVLIEHAGESERGCQIAETAMQLNPNFSGLFRFAAFVSAYDRGKYAEALELSARVDMPNYFYSHAARAAAFGQLGQLDAAKKELRELLALRPDFATAAHREFSKWYDPERVEHMIEGLRKAGLDAKVSKGTESPAETAPRDSAAVAVAIAVLPFSDMSSAKDQEYLCEGMAEEIMNALVRIDGIRVASRTSTFRARRDNSDLATIARVLSVNHVLEGSVRTAGDRLRVTAQLTDVASGFQLWSERFDRNAADVFAVQDEIAAGVVGAVRARLAPGAAAPAPARSQVGNLEAYRHYLQGRHLRYSKNDHAAALRSFEAALALDPSHAPSMVGLADVKVLVAVYGLAPAPESYAAARRAIETATQLQGETGDAVYVLGMLAFCERDWPLAERRLLRAIELDPHNVRALCWLANVLVLQGRKDDARGRLEHAREIDPLAPYPYAMSGFSLMVAGQPGEAMPILEQALAFDPENSLALWNLGLALVAAGRAAEAVSALERATTPTHRGGFIDGMRGWALASAGRIEEARTVLETLRSRPATAPTVVSEGWLLAALGDTDAAFALFDRAAAEYQQAVNFRGLPPFDALRNDPRFAGLLATVGLTPTGAL